MARYPRKILSSTYTAPTNSTAVGVYTMVEELYKRQQPISQVFCDAKLKLIEVNRSLVSSVI